MKTEMHLQTAYFQSGKTRSADFRIRQLRKLREGIKTYEQKFFDALKQDLNKTPFEAYATELGMVLEEITFLEKHIEKWMKPRRASVSMTNFPSTAKIYPEPYGVSLILAPWNYPVQLTLSPLAGAIAAGCCVVLKPSEFTPSVSRVLAKMIGELYPQDYITVMEGGITETQALLAEPFDHIFFTGSTTVGKIVMEAAAKHLTPVILELGGKSPCIVDETADLDLAAKRIVWGKFLNAGQTCVAPDYLLVQDRVKEALLKKIKNRIAVVYGTELPGWMPKIISPRHFQRLEAFYQDGVAVTGGWGNPQSQQIFPTILDQVSWESSVMREEIFGPVLPVLSFPNLEEVIARLRDLPKPLAAYYFTRDKKRERQFLEQVPFGGGCVNDTIMHLAGPGMPFGGVGASGMGAYHGKASFDAFSHQKSVLKKAGWLDIPFRYPPYQDKAFSILRRILK